VAELSFHGTFSVRGLVRFKDPALLFDRFGLCQFSQSVAFFQIVSADYSTLQIPKPPDLPLC
jgi:hypothetical protein